MGATLADGDELRLDQFLLRPFQSSTTFVHLRRDRAGVFHVTDDVLLISEAVTGRWSDPPAILPVEDFPVPRLADTCRWYAFHVTQLDATEARATMHCRVTQRGRDRDFIGFHRARHAVLELAILISRLHLLPHDDILSAAKPLQAIVDKTAGPSEQQAFRLLMEYANEHDRRGRRRGE